MLTHTPTLLGEKCECTISVIWHWQSKLFFCSASSLTFSVGVSWLDVVGVFLGIAFLVWFLLKYIVIVLYTLGFVLLIGGEIWNWWPFINITGFAWGCCAGYFTGLTFLYIMQPSFLVLACCQLIQILWQGCTILSGDVIIRHLAEQLRPDYVVFLVSTANHWFSDCYFYALSGDIII